mmetsp:Transcript_40037/g.96608  ORF Transcript_40037/g.96608 Transcript_40037/m.96608 type:complete len:85 (-) Transcript_40037:410-664(-)
MAPLNFLDSWILKVVAKSRTVVGGMHIFVGVFVVHKSKGLMDIPMSQLLVHPENHSLDLLKLSTGRLPHSLWSGRVHLTVHPLE